MTKKREPQAPRVRPSAVWVNGAEQAAPYPSSPLAVLTSLTLLERVSECDEGSWDRFYAEYSRLIRRYLGAMGFSRDEECRQIIQDVMVFFFESKVRRYDPKRGRFHSYLYGVTRNKAYEWRRRNIARDRLEPFDDTSETKRLDDKDPAPALVRRLEQAERLDRLLKKLEQDGSCNPIHLQAFLLWVVDGCKAEEVARQLGIKENNLYQIKSRIGMRLRQLYEQEVKDGA